MKDNETEEISYKDMWLRLKAKVEALREEAEAKADLANTTADFKELITVQGWIDTVLHYMKEEEVL